METLQKFVNVTFHFATQYGLDLFEAPSASKQDPSCNLGKFVKSETKREGTTDPQAYPMDTVKGASELKTEDVALKKEPAETPTHNWKNVVGLTEKTDATGPKPSGHSVFRHP